MASQQNPSRRRRRFRWRGRRLWFFIILVGLIIPVLGLGWGAYRARAEAKALKTDYHTRNFVGLASTIQRMGGTLGAMRTEAILLGWLDAVPYVRGYYLNGMNLLTAGHLDLHVLGQVLPPVMDAIYAPGSASARQQKISQAVSQSGQLMNQLLPEMYQANHSIQLMNPNRMPAVLQSKGLSVGTLRAISTTLLKFTPTMTGPHPILATLLGMPNPVQYLLIFQNSGELRATGGFMTAYAYVPFSDGKLGKIHSQNIQNLDTKVTYQPPAPSPIVGSYLPVTYWHLRDTNTALANNPGAVPDIPETVNTFYQFYDSIPGASHINGMAFIDTWFVDGLIGDVGGLYVPTIRGKTVHLTEQNANYEMEYMAEGQALPSNLRKLFIGTMMKELMHKVFHGHLSELLKVAGTFGQALHNEDVMFYFNNPAAEQFAVSQGWGGVIPAHVNGDFVEVVDQNLLGHKDNYWVRESYDVNIKTENGKNLETVTIHWTDPALVQQTPPYLTVPYHSWVTVFFPNGSNMIGMTGTAAGGDNTAPMGIDSYVQPTTDPTLNKEELGAHMNLPGRLTTSEPPSTGTVVATAWLPPGVNIHHILLQKQPGMLPEPVTVTVNGVTKHITLTARTWLNFR